MFSASGLQSLAGLPRRQGTWTGTTAITLAPTWVNVTTGLNLTNTDLLLVTFSDATTLNGERRKASHWVIVEGFTGAFNILTNYDTSYVEFEIVNKATGEIRVRRGSATAFQLDKIDAWEIL